MARERDAANAYLASGSAAEGAAILRGVLARMDRALIERHVAELVEKGLAGMLEHGRVDDLKRMHALFTRVGRTDILRTHFGHYVKVRAPPRPPQPCPLR